MDSTGSAFESFDSRDEALAMLDRVIEANPDAAQHVAVLEYDDDGEPVGDPIWIDAPGSAVPA